ncbi:maltose ABC transporter permease MalF [Corallincola spongiicola]|uniref:Maltose/maltodextrin transport system permease protein n=2 Tax=Corallincola spongiicola TaxID=2520508 RepID=A0ABY1WQQ0_9GAMM|nr:maltose ABC transporter permease MalF [Corallincola spongiicola]
MTSMASTLGRYRSPKKPLSSLLTRVTFIILFVILFALFSMGLVRLYALGEYAVAIVCLIVGLSASYITLNKRLVAWRFLYPALLLIFLMMLFPIVYSVAIGFTNYSSKNLLTYERVVNYHLEQTYAEKKQRFKFQLYQADNQYQITLNDGSGLWLQTPFLTLNQPLDKATEAGPKRAIPLAVISAAPSGEPLAMRDVIKLKAQLKTLALTRDNEPDLMMYGFREFLPLLPRYEIKQPDNLPMAERPNEFLYDNQDKRYLQADFNNGFYTYLNDAGEMTEKTLSPGFVTHVGWKNYHTIFAMDEDRKNLAKVALWTVSFALLTVLMQFSLGMLLASLLNWHRVKGQRIFRTLLLIPFAVPAFISIMIFRAMFNSEFGDVNALLEFLFGMRFEWYFNPWLAKLQVLLVNLWLGFPYFMLLAMGMLKSIPSDLYEAANMDGAGTWYKFRFITLPMIIKSLTPLLIMSFTFNFNNFLVIALLTRGGPRMDDATVLIGETQLLINYIYDLANGSVLGYQAYGLASALSGFLFLVIASISLWQFWLTREKSPRSELQEH